MAADYILEFRDITKKYPGTVALDGVNVAFRPGEVHAICGENGAGKSTLIKTCSGAIEPTSGSIYVDGLEHKRFDPITSREAGIAVIYQELNLVNPLSVCENVFLGCAPRKGIAPDFAEMERRTAEIFEEFKLPIDPRETVENLSVGKQQMVEIAKAVLKNSRILIMDEPTAPLTTSEVDILMKMIGQLKEKGVTVIYISHRLEEIFRIADRVTVLRDGKLIKTLETGQTDRDELIKLMVGRSLTSNYPARQTTPQRGEVVLETRHLSGNGVHDVNIKIYKGEVVALGGIMGAGRTELAQLLFGFVRPTSGEILFREKPVRLKEPADARDCAIALVPEDRKQQGVILGMSIAHNVTLAQLRRLCRRGFIDFAGEKRLADEMKESIGIKTPDMAHEANSLSGGNQQKVVLAKWLATRPELIILDEPTRGIDVGAKYEIYELMNRLVAQGMTILMISSDMEELVGMADRVIVLCEGRVSGELQRAQFDKELILKYASKAEGIA